VPFKYTPKILTCTGEDLFDAYDVGIKRVSMKGKRFITSLEPEKYIERLLPI
jgi:hypothetical protein